jgi:putative transposase
MTVKIKKYIACLVLMFSVLYVTSGTNPDKTHEAFKEDHGVWVNHKKVLRLMQAMNLRSIICRKRSYNYFNNEIVAYQMSLRNDNQLVLQTFEKAFNKTKDVTGLIVHSDQGFQYTSYAYHDMLPKVGVQISMSRRGNCHDNASMESFFSHLKTEGLYPYHIRSLDETQRQLKNIFIFITITDHKD